MSNLKHIKVSDHVYERLSVIVDKLKVSFNDLIQRLLDYYETGLDHERPIKSRIDIPNLINKFEAKCSRCGKTIPVGEQFRYIRIEYEDGGKEIIKICNDCNINSALSKIYKKKRELEVIIKDLRNEANELVAKIKELEVTYSLSTLKNEVNNMWFNFKNTLLSEFSRNDEKLYQDIELFLKKQEQIINKLNEIEMSIKILPKLKIRKRKSYETTIAP